VTICVAAMSDGGKRVFGASDRMLTGRDVEFEPSQSKVIELTSSIAILVAGDTAMQIEVAYSVLSDVRSRLEAEPGYLWNVSDVADLYSHYYNEARSKRSESSILALLGLNRISYLDRQQQLAPELVLQLASKLTSFEAPRVQAIVLGVDSGGGHIYVCDNGAVSCQDSVGFAAIGIGHWHANSQFMFGGHTKWKAMPETLLMTYFAKKRSEVAPGIGAFTDMLIIGPDLDSYIKIGDEPLETLERIWQRAQSKRKELEREAEEEINKYVKSLDEAGADKQETTDADAAGTQITQPENDLGSPEKDAPSKDTENGT
jgi:20S proteasome alpha/beta subunit